MVSEIVVLGVILLEWVVLDVVVMVVVVMAVVAAVVLFANAGLLTTEDFDSDVLSKQLLLRWLDLGKNRENGLRAPFMLEITAAGDDCFLGLIRLWSFAIAGKGYWRLYGSSGLFVCHCLILSKQGSSLMVALVRLLEEEREV